ncbi:alpha/beta fold hydrolase [Chelatococcus sp. GCM10030263]|uniref:alpha/beta fold hydrolase n=1 Tax=Chelatococcus sp. GCM10030263 TaxID=3273387 RepID=UPI00361CB3ED
MKTGWAEVNGVSLRYTLSGEGDDVLVLIHEMGGTLESFDFVIDALGRHCRVLRYDTRGAGLSEKVRGEVELADLVVDLAMLLDELGLHGRVAVAGCAVGAAIAISFAANYPDRVSALIAMAPATGLPPERKAAARERADVLERQGTRPSIDARLESSYPQALRQDKARFEETRKRRLGMDPLGVAALTRMLAELDLTRDLAAVRCPTLVIAGRHDGDRPPAVVAPVAAAIPGARLVTLETGHFMALQTPELVAEAIEAFLAEQAVPR